VHAAKGADRKGVDWTGCSLPSGRSLRPIHAEPGDSLRLFLEVRPDVHPRRIKPAEERLVVLGGLVDELQAGIEKLLVNRFHTLLVQGSGVFDLLRAVRIGPRMQHTTRSELLPELGVLRIILAFRFFLRIKVIEISEELVEAVHGRQELVAVTEVVLAELAVFCS
jgi:hypothetical protein